MYSNCTIRLDFRLSLGHSIKTIYGIRMILIVTESLLLQLTREAKTFATLENCNLMATVEISLESIMLARQLEKLALLCY